jgi:ArsR family transcriptional regulator
MKEKELERVFKAFANRRRIAIVRLLRDRGRSSVGSISSTIKLSFKSTSRHLSILSAADIVGREQTGLTVFYSLSKDESDTISRLISAI